MKDVERGEFDGTPAFDGDVHVKLLGVSSRVLFCAEYNQARRVRSEQLRTNTVKLVLRWTARRPEIPNI